MKKSQLISIAYPFTILCALLFFTPSCVAFNYLKTDANKTEAVKSKEESETSSDIEQNSNLKNFSSSNESKESPILTEPDPEPASSSSSAVNKSSILPVALVAPVVAVPVASAPIVAAPVSPSVQSQPVNAAPVTVGESADNKQPCLFALHQKNQTSLKSF